MLHGPAGRPHAGEQKELRGDARRRQHAGHRLKGQDFLGGGIGIEVHREGLDQHGPVGAGQPLDPGIGLLDTAALQPDPDRTIQPAGEHR